MLLTRELPEVIIASNDKQGATCRLIERGKTEVPGQITITQSGDFSKWGNNVSCPLLAGLLLGLFYDVGQYREMVGGFLCAFATKRLWFSRELQKLLETDMRQAKAFRQKLRTKTHALVWNSRDFSITSRNGM